MSEDPLGVFCGRWVIFVNGTSYICASVTLSLYVCCREQCIRERSWHCMCVCVYHGSGFSNIWMRIWWRLVGCLITVKRVWSNHTHRVLMRQINLEFLSVKRFINIIEKYLNISGMQLLHSKNIFHQTFRAESFYRGTLCSQKFFG